MNAFKKILYRFVYPACLIFTVFSIIFYIASSRLSADSETVSSAYLMLAAAAYAFVLSLISLVLRANKPAIVKVVIHYLLILATLIIILLISGDTFQFSSKMWIVGIYTAVYLAVAVPCLIVHYRKKSEKEDSEEYKKVFKTK